MKRNNIIHLCVCALIGVIAYFISSRVHVKYAIVPHDSTLQTYERVYETKDAAQSYIRDYEEYHHYKVIQFFVISEGGTK